MDQSPLDGLDDGMSASQSARMELSTSQDAEASDMPAQTSPGAEHGGEQASKPALPMQKRRRVTRACDECRRKKIKCDGKQPCTHCTVYSYDCTFDQPSNRRRNATPQYVEALENRCRRYEALLRAILPNVDLNDPRIEPALRRGLMAQMQPASADASHNNQAARPVQEQLSNDADGATDARLESMVRATGQLDLDEQGNWDYHGHSSGLSFMRRLREQFGDIMGAVGRSTPFLKSRPMSQVGTGLAPKSVALELADNAINDATILLRFVHWPSFVKKVDRIYDIAPEDYGTEENSFLPLLYTALAVGSLFAKAHAEVDSPGYGAAIDEGFKYFKAARKIMDIADCRDLDSLQAIAFMIIFLQCSAKLSTCYSYIGVALRAALRMGMHRSFADGFNPIEAETRKRLFWVLRKMDIFVGALLGLPHAISDDEIDQDYPSEVNDENITEKGITPMIQDTITVIAASNAHTDLLKILSKIVRYIYPIKGSPANQGRYSVSYAKIREIEMELNVWIEGLPMGLKPGGEAPPMIVRVQQMLRMAYAHAQMMLYRPFVHYVSNCKSQEIDKRSYACASACVSVSRNIVHICVEMKKRNLLIGGYWFSMYTTFFAILTLIFFALENPENAATQDVLRDAIEGKDCLAQLAKRSMAADRCTATLSPLFDQISERVKCSHEVVAANRKRRQAPSPNQYAMDNTPVKTTPEVELPHYSVKRANTVPEGLSTGESGGSAIAYPVPISHQNLSVQSTYSGAPNPKFMDASSLPPSLTAVSTSMPNMSFAAPQQHFSPLTSTADFASNSGSFYPPIPDLSAMMFPSADPFAYPNPPMTTFENSAFNNLAMNFNGASGPGAGGLPQPSTLPDPLYSFPPTSHPGGNSNRNSGIFMQNTDSALPSGSGGLGTPDLDGSGELDVQLFGPMPMYMMQGGQQEQQLEPQGNNFQPQRAAQGGGAWDPNLQRGLQGGLGAGGEGVDLNQLFVGQEWAGVFGAPPGYEPVGKWENERFR
ncbi:Gypsy retrotransposon integrase-like protein 1 [Coniosporium tulheliwenetii]|uniref:Gypsy retrotransposon integrase-like protein 1 n=1 Tax=Coniosporium tulheliwenetii TaxID=3383036 RepID=A0ACC2YP88_9PEZI|nr:Gypsy retrotransposon integrase-like protein 1 [Cladosporium sp. JES 115]